MNTIEPTLEKERTLASSGDFCLTASHETSAAPEPNLSRRDVLRLGLTATATSLVGAFLAGCGGGGGDTRNTTSASTVLQFDVLWNPASTATGKAAQPAGQLNAPPPAQSLRVDFEGATAGNSFTQFFNRTDSKNSGGTDKFTSSRSIDLSAAISSPLGFRVAEAFLTLTFYAGPNGTGGKISEVKRQTIRIRPKDDKDGGYPLNDKGDKLNFTLEGRVSSIAIAPNQSVPLNIKKNLAVTATDIDGNPITLAPGTVDIQPLTPVDAAFVEATSTATEGSRILGKAIGQANLKATLDTGAGTVSSTANNTLPTPVTIYPRVEAKITSAATNTHPLEAGGTRQFSATVFYEGSPLPPAPPAPFFETSSVTWNLRDGDGKTVGSGKTVYDANGNLNSALATKLGTIDRTSGLYTAPKPVVDGTPVTIVATSTLEAQSGLAANQPAATLSDASVNFKLYNTLDFAISSPDFAISNMLIANGQVSLPASAPNLPSTAAFAIVNSNDSASVVWSVVEGSDGGTINPTSGLYTAPMHGGTFTVRATKISDPTIKKDVKILVQAVDVQAVIQ